MLVRILSAIVGLPILLFFIYEGGLAFALLVAALATVGLWEFARMSGVRQQFLLIPVLLGVWLMLAGSYLGWSMWASVGILFTFCVVFVAAILRYPYFTVEDIGVNLLGLVYIGWTFSHLIAFAGMEDGRLLVLYLFVAIWGSDSGAYFVGRFLGRHKLCPRVSPKKTVEGAIGGILTAIALLALLNLYFGMLPPVLVAPLGAAISVVGQIGDLMESLIKRHYGVKDSGSLIPGHGGVLDRFDSVMLAAPVMYYGLLLAEFLAVGA